MHYGTVAWFDAQRGIGVITVEVRIRAVQRQPLLEVAGGDDAGLIALTSSGATGPFASSCSGGCVPDAPAGCPPVL
jgi:cold shock CspA family protein